MMVLVGQIGNVVFAPRWMYRNAEDFIHFVIIPFMDGGDTDEEELTDHNVKVINFDPDGDDDSEMSLTLSPETVLDEARTLMLLQLLETRYLRPNDETGGLDWVSEDENGTAVWVIDFDKLGNSWDGLDGIRDGDAEDEEEE